MVRGRLLLQKQSSVRLSQPVHGGVIGPGRIDPEIRYQHAFGIGFIRTDELLVGDAGIHMGVFQREIENVAIRTGPVAAGLANEHAVAAIPHIKPAEENAIELMTKKAKEACTT